MRLGRIFKAISFVAAGIIILILHSAILPYAGYVVGGVVIAYAIEDFIIALAEKKLLKEGSPFFEDLVQVIIGVLLIISSDELEKVCVIWGIWSIIRESREMTEAIAKVIHKRPGIINIIESVVVIGMSVSMILEPGEHHAKVHIVLLGIELILEIVFEAVDILYDRHLAKKALAKQAEGAEEAAPVDEETEVAIEPEKEEQEKNEEKESQVAATETEE